MLKGHIKKFHGGRIYVCPYCNMSVRHRTSIRRHLENHHGDLQHEWTTPGFLDKLESETSDVNTNLSSSQQPNEAYVILTTPASPHQIPTSADLSLTQKPSQTESKYICLAKHFRLGMSILTVFLVPCVLALTTATISNDTLNMTLGEFISHCVFRK